MRMLTTSTNITSNPGPDWHLHDASDEHVVLERVRKALGVGVELVQHVGALPVHVLPLVNRFRHRLW